MNKTTMVITELNSNGDVDYKLEIDCTELSTTDFIGKIVDIMAFQGYHEVAIWRALKEKSENMIELFESISRSENEWKEI